MRSPPLIWTLTNGTAGYETQCRGIARALGWRSLAQHIRPSWGTRLLAPYGGMARRQWRDLLRQPMPHLLLASGRHAMPYARALKRHWGDRLLAVVLQNPRLNPKQFDLIWAPAHDKLHGDNVISTLTSPHDLDRGELARAARRLRRRLPANFPTRRLGVLLGGPNRAYRFRRADVMVLAHSLAEQARAGWGLCIVASRRTPAFAAPLLRARLKSLPYLLGEAQGRANPYRGILGLADAFLLTPDSVNMAGEAAFTGKPIYLAPFAGGSPKFRAFHAGLMRAGAARVFCGKLESWNYSALNSTEPIAAAIRTLWTRHRSHPRQSHPRRSHHVPA